MFGWLVQLARLAWHHWGPLVRVAPETPDDEETLWLVWFKPHGEPSRPVACVACTRPEARDVANSAIGAWVLMHDEVFLGGYRLEECDVTTEDLLRATLEVAVPLWIGQLSTRPWDELQARAAAAAQVVAEKGDIIQFKSGKKGETAKAFNALAEGIAICAFSPGGIKIFGLHFEAKHGAH